MWSDINTLTVAPDLVCCSVPVQCHKYLIATLYNRNLNFMSFEYREKHSRVKFKPIQVFSLSPAFVNRYTLRIVNNLI